MTRSICETALPTSDTPRLCSSLAELISPTMSVTLRIDATISCIVAPVRSTRAVPLSTRPTDSSISPLIWRAASALRCASVRTSLATTAKPRPCSPARAASTAALSARMFVWNAIPSITRMMSAILRELSLMPRIVSTTSRTIWPPCSATCEDPIASWLAWRALSAFWRTVVPSSSIEAAVSCSELACCSVRTDKSELPLAISPLAPATALAFVRTSCTVRARLSRMVRSAAITLSVSPARSAIGVARSPAATAPATSLSRSGSSPS